MNTIPRIIHQTWKNAEIPEKFQPYAERVRDLHPGWEYRLWTDEDARAFTARHYPHFLRVYNAMPANIMRADVIRYIVLNELGGVYLDLDYEVLRPFDDFVDRYAFVLPKNRDEDEPDVDGQWRVGNAIMASAPHQPFWQTVIDDLTEHPPTGSALGEHPDVEALTGPAYLTALAHRIGLRDGDGVWLAPRRYFHAAPAYTDPPPALKVCNESYGIHHCFGTWRPPQPLPPLWKRAWFKLQRTFGR